jgi:hypothetical protein
MKNNFILTITFLLLFFIITGKQKDIEVYVESKGSGIFQCFYHVQIGGE